MSVATAVLASFAWLYPWQVEPSEELRLAHTFLDWEATPEQVVRAGYGAGLVVAVSLTLGAFLVASSQFVLALGAISFGLFTVHAVHTTPRLWATARRTSALGAAPDLVSRAVLRMRLSPTPEAAGAFAARSGTGLLAESLAAHVRRTRHTARSGLATFGDAWGELFPSLRRSVTLVTAAGQTPAEDREQLLDQALAVVLEGTREQMQSFAAGIRTPVTALYAFGVLLPTALVALLPAAGAAGLVVTPLPVVLGYNLILPGVLVVASAWLLARRPVAFPPPNVTSDHPDVTAPRVVAPGAGCTVAVAAGLVATLAFPAWGPPIAAIGLGTGVALWLRYRPVVGVYGHIQDVEDGLSDALTLVGRRVANGHAVETAIEQAAAELDGPMGELLAAGARQQRQLQVGVHEAFLGRHGALATLPSPRVRGSIALLALAAEEGRPAGEALLALAAHVEDLQGIEQEARHSLAHVCRTLAGTGMAFGPLVAGSTVALAATMSGSDALPGGPQSLVWLGGPVGVYVLVLAVLLRTLATGLTRGIDRSLVGYRVGRALVSATLAYLGSYLVVGMIT